MESVGVHADATVIRIKKGAKNSKFAIVGFKANDAEEIEVKSLFQMFIIRNKNGDKVSVLYDPSEPETVMIDNGIWNWDQPSFGLLGGFLLLGLAVVFLNSQPSE